MNDFWSQWPWVILGAEEDGSNDGDQDSSNDGSNDDNEGDNPPAGDSNNEGENHEDDSEKPNGLQKALAAERREKKRLERELRQLKAEKTQKQEGEELDLEAERARARTATEKAQKLAASLLQRDINQAIARAAGELKFIDAEDAINGIDRSKIVADQDDEDPTDIDIDYDSIKAQVKALATKKPHFVKRGTDDGEPTGNPFGGSRKRKKTDEDSYRELYPSL